MNNFKHSDIPELLCIGFLCHDLIDGKNSLGGTASYASIMAKHLGIPTAVLTSVGEGFEFFDVFEAEGIQLCNVLAEKTTVFENQYIKDKRTQYIYHRSRTLFPKDLPVAWEKIPIVKFCLIADEVDFSFLEFFPEALKAATIQGWLRTWDADGMVSAKELDWKVLRNIDIVFMSEDDVVDSELVIPKIAEQVGLLVVTKGKEGAVIFQDGREMEFSAFPVVEVDPTGAGDIFATSFLMKYQETNGITQAAAFAHSAASFIVEKKGIVLPDLIEVAERYEDYLAKFVD